MAFLTANKIHNGHKWLPEGAVIEVADNGVIVAIHEGPIAGAVHYDGILAPGLVNAHCHLELSHMKGLVPEHTGLIPFLQKIPRHRNDFSDEEKLRARHSALAELLQNGIVAVGDIANTTDTADLRTMDKIHCHTFVESIGFMPANAAKSFGFALQTYAVFESQSRGRHIQYQAIVPHAPYSVSADLFRLIDAHKEGAPISIHNQESEEENKYFIRKEGGVGELLHSLGIDDSGFVPTGASSLQSYLKYMSAEHPYIFVHNTHTTAEDIRFASERIGKAYWCLCPNANLYIENSLPDIDMLVGNSAKLCIGTDSLASNHQLCIVSELLTIKRYYPHISWEQLLKWATYNGACALQMEERIGSIEAGKQPGIIQVRGLDDANSTPLVQLII